MNENSRQTDHSKTRDAHPRTDWFLSLEPEARAALEARMVPRRVAAGRAIYLQGGPGDAMFRVIAGHVRIRTMSACGKEVLVALYGPGRCIGTISLMDGLPRPHDAVAEEAVHLESLSARDFHEVGEQYPKIYKALAVSYATWLRDHESMFAHGYSLEERLARRLDILLETGAAKSDEGGAWRLDFTQEKLASSVAVSRQAISRLLQCWQDDGIIDYKYGAFWVTDRNHLRRLGGQLN